MRLTLVYVRANAFRHVQSHAKSSAALGSRIGRCTAREKNLFFVLANLNTNFFFHKLKAESSYYMCVEFDFSHVCRAHKNFQLFIKLLLKISVFANFLFCLVQSKLQMSLYHLWNFHSIIINRILFIHFSRKWRSNIYLYKNL